MSYQYHVKKVVTGNDEVWEVGVNCHEILYLDRYDASSSVMVFKEGHSDDFHNWNAKFPFATVKGIYKDTRW